MIKTGTILKILLLLAAIFFLFQGFISSNNTKFLRVSGEKIVDSSGNPVMLRGFNVQFKFFKNVLGEQDIKRIADSGANSIRLVLDFRDFEMSPFRYNEENFLLLDSVLDWCERYHVYIILDMHLAPGIQNPHDFVVHRGKTYEFWSKEEYQKRFFSLWERIAERYAGKTIIAGYDLLNEGVPPGIEDYVRIMNETVKRIRSKDKKHIVIAEEAILPDGRKELALLDDNNIVYSIHYFYPPQFALYVTTTERAVLNYPGDMIAAGEKIGETKTKSVEGSGEWEKLEVRAAPPDGAEMLVVNISSKDNSGTVWFDDISLEINGRSIELPAPGVANNSFETDYPGISWDVGGSCAGVTDRAARTGKYSLSFSGCKATAYARSSPIEAEKGVYLLSAWYKSGNATGENLISISWHKKKFLEHVDRNALLENLAYALRFRSKHKVPLYVGEFTAHANPERESVVNYLSDIIGIMKDEGLHWSFWEYYSEFQGVGLYTDVMSLANPEALAALKKSMEK